MRWLAVLGLLLAVGCEDNSGDHCVPPDVTQYNCEPIPTGAYGCVGGPKWEGRHDHMLHQDDPDLIFPDRCRAEIPECSGFYRGSLRTFTCTGLFKDPPNDAGIDQAPEAPAYWSELL